MKAPPNLVALTLRALQLELASDQAVFKGIWTWQARITLCQVLF
jgi:hypothetical protein